MLDGASGLMISAAAGYWVLERAEKQKGIVKTIGVVLATIIVLVSFTGVVCRVMCVSGGGGMCALPGKGAHSAMTCPFTGKPLHPGTGN